MKGVNFKSRRITTWALFLAGVVIFFSLAPAVLALETGLSYGTIIGLGTTDVRVVIMRIIQIFLGFVGIIALILILYGGYVWMTSGGSPEKIERAKKILINAGIGLAIILLAFAIVTFIINQLLGGVIGGPGGPPDPPCVNCGILGGGIIESVYPVPGARDVPRNTNIAVTFKEVMKTSSIIADAPDTCTFASPCFGDLAADASLKPNVKIYKSQEGENGALAANEVAVSTTDRKTFVFNPKQYLGDSQSNWWYSTKLDSGILRGNSQPAFSGLGYFIWSFEIGTRLDLEPPKVINVFPIPDNDADTYTTTAATQARGSITVVSQPKIAQLSSVSAVIKVTPTAPDATVVGTYNGTYTGPVQITINSPATTATVFWSTGNPNNNSSANTTGNTITLGSGLILSITSSPAAGNQWTFTVRAAQTADGLRVSDKLYTFIGRTNPGVSEIRVGADIQETARNITVRVDDDIQSPDVSAVAINNNVNLTALVAGRRGNNIVVSASGSWPQITSMAGGADATTTATPRDKPDQPRNAIIRLDFSEAMVVPEISGVIQTDNPTTGVGRIASGDFNQITIQADVNGDGNFQDDEYVAGEFRVSNQYKNVEFMALKACKDAAGNDIENSCGEVMYCLPVGLNDATQYKVTVKAGLLKNCQNDTECQDSSYSHCLDLPNVAAGKVCNSEAAPSATSAYYPESQWPTPRGAVDMANNSLDGNKNNKAQGPGTEPPALGNQSNQDAYNLNSVDAAIQGDSALWSFFINKNIDLTPPQVIEIKPTISQSAVSLIDPLSAKFNKLMMTSTLKPDSGYGTTPEERAEKFVSLIDYSVNPVGWWISSFGEDISQPPDGYADRDLAQIHHTAFVEVTNYSGELGSGIQDIYQNCYLPSEGPATGQSPSNHCAIAGILCTQNSDCPTAGDFCACGTSRASPYCCNGVPSATECR